MDTREAPAAKAAAPQREPRDIWVLATQQLSLPKKNGFSTDRPILPVVTQKSEVTCNPSGFVLNGAVCLKEAFK